MYDRDALIAAVDLRALADDLLGTTAGRARTLMWPCPNDQHAQTGRTPPVSVFTSRRGEQRWRCHGCGDGGTAIDLVIACRGGGAHTAMAYLAGRVGHRDLAEVRLPALPARRPARLEGAVPTGCRDPQGLERYVHECATRLWTPDGRAFREWLMNDRHLPADVLQANLVGADLGPRHQDRPVGMPRSSGVVLSVVVDSRPVYAQLRTPHPGVDRPRYLNPTAALATNPRLSMVQPAQYDHREMIVTEGVIDALSAAAAGYRAVAVLSATYPDHAIALALARLPHPLVIAFDADDAGRNGARRLTALLEAHQRAPIVPDLEGGDLNDALGCARDWSRELPSMIANAATSQGQSLGRR